VMEDDDHGAEPERCEEGSPDHRAETLAVARGTGLVGARGSGASVVATA